MGQRAEYLGHLPDGHHTIQSFLKSLIILLLPETNKRRKKQIDKSDEKTGRYTKEV